MAGILALAVDRRGATAATLALMLTSLVGTVGFAVDWGLVQIDESRLQSAADAAATAAAREVAKGQARKAAETLATANMPSATYGTVVARDDIVVGYWDTINQTFTPGNTNANAVQVTARMATANGNAHRLLFGAFLGMETIDLSANAIAVVRQRCVADPTTSLVSEAKPSASRVVTQGEACRVGSGWTGTCYYATPAGNPIVRVDSAYEGPAVVTFDLASPARSFSFNAPYRGSFWYAISDITLPNTASTTMVFRNFKSSPTAPVGGGTATYVNRFNITPTLPGTPICEKGTGGLSASLVR